MRDAQATTLRNIMSNLRDRTYTIEIIKQEIEECDNGTITVKTRFKDECNLEGTHTVATNK